MWEVGGGGGEVGGGKKSMQPVIKQLWRFILSAAIWMMAEEGGVKCWNARQ